MDNGKKVLLIHNARQLLTMEGDHNNDIGLIEGGSVLIRDGLIESAGKTGDIEKLAGGLREMCIRDSPGSQAHCGLPGLLRLFAVTDTE